MQFRKESRIEKVAGGEAMRARYQWFCLLISAGVLGSAWGIAWAGQAPSPTAPPHKQTTVQQVRHEQRGSQTLVIIDANGALRPTAFMVGGERLVVDLPEAFTFLQQTPIAVTDPFIKQIRIGRHHQPERKVRVVLDLHRRAVYSVRTEGTRVLLALGNGNPSGDLVQKVAQSAPPQAVETPQGTVAPAAPPGTVPPAAPLKAEKPPEPPVGSEVRKDDAQKPSGPSPAPSAEEPVTIKKPEQPVIVEKKLNEKLVVLNFNNANIETVISAISELLEINYVLPPNITGKVTIQSYRKFPVSELPQIFNAILEMNGLAAVRDGPLYRIVPIDLAKQQPIPVEKGKDVKLVMEPGFMTQILPLEAIKASDAANMVRGLLPRGSDLIVYEPANLLILSAPPYAVAKLMKILEAVDLPLTEAEGARIFTYHVENGEARKLIEVLKVIYPEKKVPRAAVRTVQPAPPGAPVISDVPAEIEGEVVMTAYDDLNAIVFKCTPRSYLRILETLKRLDVPPKQVLIEVLVAEVTLDDTLQYGVEWVLKGSATIDGKRADVLGGVAGKPTNFFSGADLSTFAPLVSQGVFANVLDPKRFNVLISSLASAGKLHVRASPHLLALDNKEAKIAVGNDIPVATGLIQQPATGGAATTLISQAQIQYRTAGIILSVTPTINDKNQVTLKIAQESSSPGASTKIGDQEYPSFVTRKTQTMGVVQNGYTLLIGGLISETRTTSQSGIPFLSKIPVLGGLFGTTGETTTRTELLVMVTPHVITNQEDADRLLEEFKDKVRIIQEKPKK